MNLSNFKADFFCEYFNPSTYVRVGKKIGFQHKGVNFGFKRDTLPMRRVPNSNNGYEAASKKIPINFSPQPAKKFDVILPTDLEHVWMGNMGCMCGYRLIDAIEKLEENN